MSKKMWEENVRRHEKWTRNSGFVLFYKVKNGQ